jgi:uncharacterized protein with HEPN domain
MVNPDNTVYIHHISDSCKKCLKFTTGMNYEQFVSDEKTISAVVRELSVIGEAARKTTEDFRSKNPHVPWEKILGMRNRLVHDYMGVQLPIVWQTIEDDIPELKKIIDNILATN